MTDNPIDAAHLAARPATSAHPLTADAAHDEVVHPGHYTSGRFDGIECWDFAGLHTYHVGNAIKYVWRHADKGKPEQDLRKALQYLGRARDHDATPVLPGCEERAAELTRRIMGVIEDNGLPPVYEALSLISQGMYVYAADMITGELAARPWRIDPILTATAADERPRHVSGGVLDLVGRTVTVPGRLLRSNVAVVATGQLARVEAHRSGAAEYTLVGEGAAAVPTRVLVESGAIVEPEQ